MPDVMLEPRVTNLEELMAQLLITVDRVERQLGRTDRQLDRTDRQMEQTQRNLDQLSTEMRDFKDEMRESRREMNKKWGELSNKMGTMAEDLVAPSIGRILRTTVGCPEDKVDFVTVRTRKRHPVTGHEQEFDVMAGCGEYLLVNETKSRLDPEGVQDFADRLPQVIDFFPEYAGQQIIGAIASLYVDDSLVRYGERLGLIVLGFGEDVRRPEFIEGMEVLNTPEFRPKSFGATINAAS